MVFCLQSVSVRKLIPGSLLLVLVCWSSCIQSANVLPSPPPTDIQEAYFNGSSYIRLFTSASLKSLVGISFRSCVGGEIFEQRKSGHNLQVSATSEGVLVVVTSGNVKRETRARGSVLDNQWHFIALNYEASGPQITLTLDKKSTVVVANATYNNDILSWEETGAVLVVGNAFSGCMLQGPQLVFEAESIHAHNVIFGPCPLTTDECMDKRDVLTTPMADHCYHEPCMRHGVCISRSDRYECHCFARYSGNNCQVDGGPPCASNPCRHGATCSETRQGDLVCTCQQGFHGTFCELEESAHPLCAASPCRHGGTCSVPPHSDYAVCSCPSGYTGSRCEVDVDECLVGLGAKLLCLNGGRCIDGRNNYTCDCARTGYTGSRCEINVNECVSSTSNPCGNRGICFDTYGSFTCQCYEGYTGDRCQTKTSGCLCSNGGTCTERGCVCPRGWSGSTCANPAQTCSDLACPQRSHCAESNGRAQCVCDYGYYGASGPSPNCTHINQMCQVSPCQNGGVCSLGPNRDYFNCTCPSGFAGMYCELTPTGKSMFDNGASDSAGVPVPAASTAPKICADNPCVHAKTCHDFSSGYYCDCDPSWAGIDCDITLITNCSVQLCQNGGDCTQNGPIVFCKCPAGFTGKLCERPITSSQDACAFRPCLNGGACRLTRRSGSSQAAISTATPTPTADYICDCPQGFEGTHCEKSTDSATATISPSASPCEGVKCGNGTCHEDGESFKCTCNEGFTGMKCETDIDECKIQDICNQGICVNKQGGFECYCKPGYTGVHCDVDFDECLSRPCQNNGTCQNKINNYECVCVPGFTGKDCSININECLSSPCAAGSTCVDGIATFKCVCLEGLTGPTCEINIDDCESAPCLHNGVCHDELNGFSCDCAGTGYSGKTCAINIDDCAPQPCRNGAACRDQVNSYDCLCYPGYTGKNCEQDIAECDSSPCQYNGICLERSNISLYQPSTQPDGSPSPPVQVGPEAGMLLPDLFFESFSYENASGYECVCVTGVIGLRCQVNVNECESSPCGPWGTCVDRVGRYDCDCEPGFEGDHCQFDIDECDRYKPCKHGTCYDRRASYYCECESGYGGYNCSVQLTGCEPKPEPKCLNGGDCKPWLQQETVHRFNCTCGPGYHGTTCEKITTMSLGGHSYIAVNTTRDEGYDIQFRFKTTLGSGLLAIGKGLTFYILELLNGRLNLHSSLLNKWEGVFIGSNLNDSNWQKVFVAINSSHLVLAANEEQTIYPINLNEGSNSSHTSFPTTYAGGTVSSLSRLTHGPPAFVGCIQDLTINGEWVLPDEHADNGTVELREVTVGCPRAPQCDPNPCHEAGVCEDLWSTFRCTCRRPHLGNTCQYNMTAATFGHESVVRSGGVAEVRVSEAARKAIRSVLDISMFVRTRKPTGLIFYLGTRPKEDVGLFGLEETYVAASLVGGELLVRLQFNHTSEAYTVGGTRLDNGYDHLIQVVRNATLVQVKLNGTEYFRKPISAAGQLDAQVLYLGGPPTPTMPATTATPSAAIPLASRGARHVRSPAEAVTLAPFTGVATTSGSDAAATQLPSQTAHMTAQDELDEENFFKGVIQDVQISNGSYTMAVELFPLKASDAQAPPAFGPVTFDPSSILEGVVSDDACAPQPCNHEGVCKVTWNDYRCICPRGFKGKSCDDMEFCQLQDCPLGSTCRNLDGGYECLANATFDGVNSTLMYRLEDDDLEDETIPNFQSLLITYRSKTGGTLMYVRSRIDASWMSVSVYRDQLTVEWWMADNGAPTVKRFRKETPDYDWSTILIIVVDGSIKGGFNDWVREESPSFSAEMDIAFWQRLMTNGDLYLGGVKGPNATFVTLANASMSAHPTVSGFGYGAKDIYVMDSASSVGFTNRIGRNDETSLEAPTESTRWHTGTEYVVDGNLGENFKGCMGEVRVGDLLLPYYTPEELYQDPSVSMSGKPRMSLLNSRKGSPYVALGCVLCFEKDCQHGGHCQDIATDYRCACPDGYADDDCSVDIDECVDSKCQNGATCVDSVANYTCDCVPGWEGWLCESVKDECILAPCQNGGSCTQLAPGEALPRGQINRWRCLCPVEWAGLYCAEPARRNCAHEPCASGATCIDTAEHDPITGNKFSCVCAAGYEGPLCDIPFCHVRACQNGGTCKADDFQASCLCAAGWAGHSCELNIDECAVQEQTTRQPPCQHNGRCIDGVAEYICDCTGTGFSGVRCQTDIDECANQSDVCGQGTCVNTEGSFRCECPPGLCGIPCELPDPCITDDPTVLDSANVTETPARSGPCVNQGVCTPACTDVQDYICKCTDEWTGKNCTEEASTVDGAGSGDDDSGSNTGTVALAVGITLLVLAIAAGALVALAASARSKRATRGTYSPSSQEYCNPRLELDAHALKPPPEERLI